MHKRSSKGYKPNAVPQGIAGSRRCMAEKTGARGGQIQRRMLESLRRIAPALALKNAMHAQREKGAQLISAGPK